MPPSTPTPIAAPIAGVILAGGKSRRMDGADKALLELGDKRLIDHVLDAARPQADPLVLNGQGAYAGIELPLAPDTVPGFAGPLAGILAGLEWVKANAPECIWMASFACDTPFLPTNLVDRLISAQAQDNADLACATSDGRDHPVFGLWRVSLADAIRHAITEEGISKVDRWTARYRLARVDFPVEPVDPFFNINTAEDLERAARLLVGDRTPAKGRQLG